MRVTDARLHARASSVDEEWQAKLDAEQKRWPAKFDTLDAACSVGVGMSTNVADPAEERAGQRLDALKDELAEAKRTAEEQKAVAHNHIGHNYIGRNSIGHNYIGHYYIGHNYTGHYYIGHNYTGHNYVGCGSQHSEETGCVDSAARGENAAVHSAGFGTE